MIYFSLDISCDIHAKQRQSFHESHYVHALGYLQNIARRIILH